MSDFASNRNTNKPYVLHGKLTPEILRKLYQEDLLTDKEIAAHYGVSDVAISKRRKRAKIETITDRQRRERKSGYQGPSLDDLTPQVLADLYSKMGDRQIAKLYGVKKPAIKNLRKKWDIGAVSKTDRTTSHASLTDEQKEVLIGIMLGDGHLLERGVFKLSHVYYQYHYLCRVHAVLSEIAMPILYTEKTMKDTGELTSAFEFKSVQHAWLKTLRNLFYPEGERIYPDSVLKSLSERSLAYWYFDDGTLDSGLASFALGDLSDAEAERVAHLVSNRFGFTAYVQPYGADNCKNMQIKAVSSERFFRLVADFATPDMLYKIPYKFRKEDSEVSFDKTKEAIQLPKPLRERCKKEGHSEQLVADLFDAWRGLGFPVHNSKPKELWILSKLERTHKTSPEHLKARQVGQASCQAFMPHIWDAHSYKRRSPRSLFEDDATLKAALSDILREGRVPNPSVLRNQLRSQLTGVYNFRPATAKLLVDRYCPKGGVVFDPCAGWGGRMMGALMSKSHVRYVCCEPSTKTVEGLENLSTWMGQHVPGLKGRVEIHQSPAESFEFPKADLVITSPPYWKREIYAEEDTQSSSRYSTYEVWVARFLGPLLEKSMRCLRAGGVFLLNVADFRIGQEKYSLTKDVKKIMADFGFGEPEELRYELPSRTKEYKYEPVFVWSKSGERVRNIDMTPVVVTQPESTKPMPRLCQYEGCTNALPEGSIKTKMYCREHKLKLDADRARKKRQAAAAVVTHRTSTCRGCEVKFDFPVTEGSPKLCPQCRMDRETQKAEKKTESRTRNCAYRHCGREFVDTSSKSSYKFCHTEHCRREKLFRTGKVSSLSQFRKADPVLDDGPAARIWTCRACQEKFEQPDGRKIVRCLKCVDESRNKTCQTEGCETRFRDSSLKSNQRFCESCQKAKRGGLVVRKKLDPELLRSLVEQGLSVGEIAAQLEVGKTTVRRYLKRFEIPSTPSPDSE